jgi:hypothetical protein
MTQERLYKLAHTTAVRVWLNAKERLDKDPDDKAREAEEKAWDELQEIKKALMALGVSVH